MPERIAIKLLRSTDLTFFDSLFKRTNGGKQKAINLNADVFAKQFYPDLAERSLGNEVEEPVTVTVYGPRPGKPYRFARSVTKKRAYKNWRLNGAAVPDPDDETGRFDHLLMGDLAVFEFFGDATPIAVKIVLISSQDDPELHDRLAEEIPGGKRSMVALSRARLSKLALAAPLGSNHPLRALLVDPELEEVLEQACLGVAPAVRKLRERIGRTLTKADLQSAKANAERVGDDGEALAFIYLNGMVSDGKIPPVKWTAFEDAGASWDFETTEGEIIRFDAKATIRRFDVPFHLSAAETVAAASDEIPYRIIRLFGLSEDGADAKISDPVNSLAKEILSGTTCLPVGVLPTGFTIDPNALTWGEVFRIERPDEPET